MTTYLSEPPPPAPAPKRDRRRTLVNLLTAVLVVAALVLGVMVVKAIWSDPTEAAEPGSVVPLRAAPYGADHTVMLPGSEVTVRVAEPVETVDYDLLEYDYEDPRQEQRRPLRASDGGSLVPVSWSIRATGGFAREEDTHPIEVRLIAGDESVDLTSVTLANSSATIEALDPDPVVVPLADRVRLRDLAVEVEYDGLVQTLDVATGEVAAGAAQPLYGTTRNFSPGCAEVEDRCALGATDTASPLRPGSSTVTVSSVTLYPYDRALGWAEDGTVWAGVRIHALGVSGVNNAAGDSWTVARFSAPSVSLDGFEPVRREDLKATDYDTYGRVVLAVPADHVASELTIGQVLTLEEGAPQRRLSIGRTFALEPVD